MSPIFIHPLLNRQDNWSGYLVETLTANEKTIPVLEMLETHLSLNLFDKRQIWFLPVPCLNEQSFLPSTPHIAVFPALQGLDAEQPYPQEALIRQANGKLGLKVVANQKLPEAGNWHVFLIEAMHARSLPPMSLLGLSTQVQLVGTGIQNHTDASWLKEHHVEFFTTEYLLTHAPLSGKADLTRLKLLELLSLIANDADTAEIEAIFKQEPKLAYSLLRLVNSAANSPRNPITSFSTAINLLGRRQLQRWLQLLVYADPNNGHQPNPLLQKAATRGRLIEHLVEALNLDLPNTEHRGDAAFMTGTFSLLHVLLHLPMRDIIQQLPLPAVVSEALGNHAGLLGEVLQLVEASDKRDLKTAHEKCTLLGLCPEKHLQAQLSALAWAAKIHTD